MAAMHAVLPSVNAISCRRISGPSRATGRIRANTTVAMATRKVEIEHAGGTTILDVKDGESILEVALDNGLDLPHDCKLGVCLTCPARLVIALAYCKMRLELKSLACKCLPWKLADLDWAELFLSCIADLGGSGPNVRNARR